METNSEKQLVRCSNRKISGRKTIAFLGGYDVSLHPPTPSSSRLRSSFAGQAGGRGAPVAPAAWRSPSPIGRGVRGEGLPKPALHIQQPLHSRS